MNTTSKIKLENICYKFMVEFEHISSIPVGSCYLIGNVLSMGFKESGLISDEVTGHLILKDRDNIDVIYGPDSYQNQKGHLVGYYHTWCVLEYEGERIIVDPSIKHLKSFLRKHNIKIHPKIPDTILTTNFSNTLYTYKEDVELVEKSKSFLNKINPSTISILIEKVRELSVILKDN